MPEFILLKASAGSGKTYRLAERFLSFLLTPAPDSRIRRDLSNILAITFTKNAAREMKERILVWLKECSLGDEIRLRELSVKLSIAGERLPGLAEKAVEEILSGYTDFQVSTIDGFITAVFKAAAVDLGVSPDFEVVLDPGEIIDYAFSRFLRAVMPGSAAARDFERILDDLVLYRKKDAGFLWDPAPEVRARLAAFYGKLAARRGDFVIGRFGKDWARLQKALTKTANTIDDEIVSGGLERNPASQYWSKDVGGAVRAGRLSDLVGLGLKRGPAKKPGRKGDLEAYERIEARMKTLRRQAARSGSIHARDFFAPYLKVYRKFLETLSLAKRRQGIVFLEDMARDLADYLNQGIVPDVYIRLGDRIFHYLIDEFQDTSPLQWADLKPLIEESLSKGGSLFLVGDTKQAIYGFRDADYEIMRNLELGRDGFGPAEASVDELKTNWRSRKAILDFVKRIFLQLDFSGKSDEPKDVGGIKKTPRAAADIPAAAKDVGERYAAYARLSGLLNFEQDVEASLAEPGYVEVSVLERTTEEDGAADDGPEGGDDVDSSSGADALPEKKKIQDLIARLRGRGYSPGDIAVLTYKNEDVVRVASWLNEKKIPFIPFSSLDIRLRKVVREVLALLRFFDSPPDDLSFAAFLLGDIFRRRLEGDRGDLARSGAAVAPDSLRDFLFACRRAGAVPLYPAFRERHPVLWDRYFERGFRAVGFFPIYDLVTLIFRVFDVFALFPDEEAALTRLLEAVKEFEGRGRNDIREFLTLSASDTEGSAWTIDVPREIPAVRIMSIHKAKGLGFPVVILLLYGQEWRPPDFFVQNKDDGLHVYKITSAIAEADAELGEVYEEQKTKDWVGLLNMLYVGMTRARAELYVVGVKSPGDHFPFDLIEAGLAGRPDAVVPGPGAALRDKPSEAASKASLVRLPGLFEPLPKTRTSLNLGRVRRGEIAHRILADLEIVEPGGWERAASAAVARLVPAEPEEALFTEMGRSIAAAFEGSPLGELFVRRPGRRVLREFDFCDAAGRVFRMDRVVVDPDEVRVADFKTGGESRESDRAQVRGYAAILREIFPGRPVRAVLVYIDSRDGEELS